MIELFNSKHDCCGCSACFNICPQNAISMKSDKQGFKYPSIDVNKCVQCGLCKRVCAFQNDQIKINKNLHTYAAKHIDEDVRANSTSGGAFTAISDWFINNGGVVYGVKFNKDIVAVHSRATTIKQRDEFKGSKYVQSELNTTFEDIKKDLNDNKKVLFTGTPCQCDSLCSFLTTSKTDFSNLILCDIVCHGTPSPLIFAEHIKYLEKKSKSKVKDYACRHKVNGWHSHTERCVYENGVADYQTQYSQAHKKIFYSHNTLRPCCHNCKYTSINRHSDITIADYWGIEKILPEFDDDKGVSLILINTLKGETLFNDIKHNLIYIETNVQDCLQPQLIKPTACSPKREEFWKDYRKKGYEYILKKYVFITWKHKIKILFWRILVRVNLIVLVNKILKK